MSDPLARLNLLVLTELFGPHDSFRPGAKVLAALRAFIDSPHPPHRDDSLLALEQKSPAAAFELSVEKLRAGDVGASHALWVINRHIQRHDALALEAVRSYIRAGGQNIEAAIGIFAKMRDVSSLDWLCSFITSDTRLRIEAMRAYSTIDPHAGSELFRAIAQDRSADTESRIVAVQALGRNRDSRDLPLLRSLGATPSLATEVNNVLFREFAIALAHPLFREISQLTSVVPIFKSGSELYLLPGRTDRVVRVIHTSAFEQWKKAWDALPIWRAHGFDDAPVEEIIAAGSGVGDELGSEIADSIPVPHDHIAVLARVIPGLTVRNLQAWPEDPDAVRQMRAQKVAILRVIRALEIFHGHPHEDNFVMAGDRLYLIDFDQARRLTDQDVDESRLGL